MAQQPLHAAIDLGAGSGRVVIGALTESGGDLLEIHRFGYPPRQARGHLRWDMAKLLAGVSIGLRQAGEVARAGGREIVSVGADAWGVDYGLLNEAGRLLDDPICYRDPRTEHVMPEVFTQMPRPQIFARTGIQFLSFNTLFQLAAHTRDGLPTGAARLLLMPDLCHHALCGSRSSEPTNASTTQLLNAASGEWDDGLFAKLGLPRALMPPLEPAGAVLGRLREEIGDETGLGAIEVIQPATHDTASAVAGAPLEPGWAYISSGTWSLVGVERATPLLHDAVLQANVTNEVGVSGTIRFLKNVMGLWILDACRREWRAAGIDTDLSIVLTRAAAPPGTRGVVFPDAPRFFNPASMTRELCAALTESWQPAQSDPAALTQVILDSLALRYASVVATIEALIGECVAGVHIIGGGSLNDYLNQATADACARPVLAGPTEATSLGNLLVQSVACGQLSSLAAGRRAVAAAFPPRRFEPRDTVGWRDARRRYAEIEQRY